MEKILSKQNPEEVTNIFFEIIECFTKSIEKISIANNTLDEVTDSRIIVFAALRQVTNSSLLSSIFIKDHLINKEWWTSNKNFTFPPELLEQNAEKMIYSYGVDLSTNYIMLSFIHFETSLRSFVKAIPNTKYPNATEDFWKLRDYLIEQSKMNDDYKNLLKIFQTIRNSNHSGGFHTKDDLTIIYKTKTFVFEKGKPISFDLWTSIKFIMLELNEFLYDLVTSDLINSIPKIEHPFGTINFVEES